MCPRLKAPSSRASTKHERTLILPPESAGRLDATLSRLLSGVSRRRLKAAFKEGRILQDGRAARGSDSAIPEAHVRMLDLPDSGAWSPAPEPEPDNLGIEVVYQDSTIVVAEKPAGVPSHPRDPGEGGSVAEILLRMLPDMHGVGDHPDAPGLCHRLDVDTSGLLLFARTNEAFQAIRRQFREHSIDKRYVAAVGGVLEGYGTIDVRIGRQSKRRMIANPPANIRAWPARTKWKVRAAADRSTLLDVTLETGVTHQVRVHLAWLGHPVMGDARSGGVPAPRLGLHACRLGLRHPSTNEWVTVESRRGEEVADMVVGAR